jgi:hypothetical protein
VRFVFDDGGRKAAGYKGSTGDCTCRAIAIATGMPYQSVYDLLNDHAQDQRLTKRQPRRGSARTGIVGRKNARSRRKEPGNDAAACAGVYHNSRPAKQTINWTNLRRLSA